MMPRTSPLSRSRIAGAALACVLVALPASAQTDPDPDGADTPLTDTPLPELAEPTDRSIVSTPLDGRDPARLARQNAIDTVFRIALRALRAVDHDGDVSTVDDPRKSDYRALALAIPLADPR